VYTFIRVCAHTHALDFWKLAYFCSKSEIKLGSVGISTYQTYLLNVFPYINLNIEMYIFEHTFRDTFHRLQILPSSKVNGMRRAVLYIVHVTAEMDTLCRCLLWNFCLGYCCYSRVCFCDAR
jgi:hypothetical protein